MENINYNITSLIDFLGLVQGLFLGFLLIIENKKNRPSLLLGLFLVTYSFELLEVILEDLGLIDQHPSLLFLPINFFYLVFPLFYLYVRHITNDKLRTRSYLVLLPGIIEFIVYTVLFLLPSAIKLELYNTDSFMLPLEFFQLLSFPYSIYFIVKILRRLNRHKKNVENYYSNVSGRLVSWARWVVLLIIFQISFLFVEIFQEEAFFEKYTYPILAALNVIFIFWLGISGLRQSRILTSMEKTGAPAEKNPQEDKKAGENLPKSDDYEQVTSLMQEKQLFKEPDLSLADLSRELNMSQRSLSQLINQFADKNFNQFVNHYRVEEAKRILKDDTFNKLNMLGVAYEAGFNSKATFYAVFKQITNTTPNAFKKQLS